MNEQDIIHNIKKQTKDLPIPDSISPDSMKKMLDDHINTDNNTANSSTPADTGRHNRYIRRFTVAACAVLVLAGGLGISTLLLNPKSATEKITDHSSGNTESKITEKDDAEAIYEDLAYQTNLSIPESYNDYYDALKTAYDNYYDSISTVDTGDADIMIPETAVEESVEDSAATNSFRSSDTTKQAAANGENSNDYSTTNTQEKEVDEGDIIKTDGTYIYRVSQGYDDKYGDRCILTITQTENGNLKAMSTINLNEELSHKNSDTYIDFEEFYLYKNQLVLMYQTEVYNKESEAYESISYIVIYDIKDKENPKKIKTLSQSGWYGSSRISDGYLYTISNFTGTSLENRKKYSHYIPSINGEIIACNNIYYPEDVIMQSTHVITSLDLSNPTDFTDSKAIPVSGGETYVSDSSIYFYATVYSDVTKTEIMKVGYEKGKLSVGRSATVAGYLYDSFALSEYDGYLRIVATIPANNISLLRSFATEDVANTGSTNTVREDVNTLYILDKNMELTGKLVGLAPGEKIYSARFMGNTGYFVTFRNMDPLFSVDLSDPANPKILDTLKIPGFSNYLHFYDENLLLGIGEEIDPDTLESKGIKLSMFDISNPSDVTEKDKYIIKDSYYSDALYNHKAIMIDPVKNIFGFVYYGEASKGTNYEAYYYYVTYTYDKEKGFVETAKYPIKDDSGYETNGVRGVYIGDYLYITTNKSITSYEIGSTNPIAQIYFK